MSALVSADDSAYSFAQLSYQLDIARQCTRERKLRGFAGAQNHRLTVAFVIRTKRRSYQERRPRRRNRTAAAIMARPSTRSTTPTRCASRRWPASVTYVELPDSSNPSARAP